MHTCLETLQDCPCSPLTAFQLIKDPMNINREIKQNITCTTQGESLNYTLFFKEWHWRTIKSKRYTLNFLSGNKTVCLLQYDNICSPNFIVMIITQTLMCIRALSVKHTIIGKFSSIPLYLKFSYSILFGGTASIISDLSQIL